MLISRTFRATLWSAILCGSSISQCQTSALKQENSNILVSAYVPHMTFDLASIRESRKGNVSYIDNIPKSSLFLGERLSAWGLIVTAYDLKIGKLLENVPRWAETIRLDVTAKSDASTDEALAKLSDDNFDAEKRHMLREMLADRFKLQIHSETRTTKTYELIRTKRTAELMRPVQGEVAKTVSTCTPHFSNRGKEVDSKGCPFTIFFSRLQQELGTNVLDRTDMSGAYAYHLTWGWTAGRYIDEEDRYSPLVDALNEQLGLELKETKGSVTFWVIDHIERPTPN